MLKLTALQSRLLASVIATGLVVILYFALSSTHFAYASELDSIPPEDHNHERLLNAYILTDGVDERESGDVEYESSFLGVNRGIIESREQMAFEVVNNIARPDNLELGETIHYVFTNSSVWGTPSAASGGLPSPGLVRAREEGDNHGEEASNVQGTTEHVSYYENDEEGLRIFKRENKTRTIYITLSTCLQPDNPKNPSAPPQLTLYVSQDNTRPGPNQPADTQEVVEAEHGFANLTFEASKDVYVGVTAPNATGYQGVYNIEIAASIDAQFHTYKDDEADLFFIDSDSSSALLATKNLTDPDIPNQEVYDKWMRLSPPYVVFANNKNDTRLSGVSHSYCGLEKYAQIAGTKDGLRTDMVRTSMTNVTLGNYPKQQFYFQGLNASSSYYGILAMTGNSTAHGNGIVGGGGSVWKTMDFTTKSDGNCAVIFNLPFCSNVNYAVPGNPLTFPDVNKLAAFYDDAAAAAYANFDRALQQIPCEIASTGQFSLATTCAQCAAAYKSWLCSVTIPRCQDFSRADPWLQARNVLQPFPDGSTLEGRMGDAAFGAAAQDVLFLNSSRNPTIDEVVRPGPYKEILPCEDVCYNLTQSCPAAMGFACPRPGDIGFANSYGRRPDKDAGEDGQITCNYPGAAYFLSGAEVAVGVVDGWMAGGVALVGVGLGLLF